MTRQETSKLIYIIASMYPTHYKGFTEETYIGQVDAWHVIMGDVTYHDATSGLKLYALHDNGFPPTPGQLMGKVKEVQRKRKLAEDLIAMGYGDSVEHNVGKDIVDVCNLRHMIEVKG